MLGGTDGEGCLETYDERQELVNKLQSKKDMLFESVKGTSQEQSVVDMHMKTDELRLIHAKECLDKSNKDNQSNSIIPTTPT